MLESSKFVNLEISIPITHVLLSTKMISNHCLLFGYQYSSASEFSFGMGIKISSFVSQKWQF